MIAAIDTHYGATTARTGVVLFERWTDATATREIVDDFPLPAAAYTPGQFFERELPCLLKAAALFIGEVDTIMIDGYVWLDGAGRKGLGARLHEALGSVMAVIGVAKTPFAGAAGTQVLRGGSVRPLIVTAAGIEESTAANHVASMHGSHRIPTLLKRADQLARRGRDAGNSPRRHGGHGDEGRKWCGT